MHNSFITHLIVVSSLAIFTARTDAVSRGFAVCVGLNSVDPTHYEGWSGPLAACENDARDMEKIAKAQGFEAKALLTTTGTRAAVIKEIRQAAEALQAGDIFMLSFAGHGGSVPDKNGDEQDGLDETWCLYDGELLDDELFEEWKRFKEGVRILVFSDSCHSATVLQVRDGEIVLRENRAAVNALAGKRAMPPAEVRKTYRKHRNFYDKLQEGVSGERPGVVKASLQLIAACKDEQLAADGIDNGVFTGALEQVWNEGRFQGDYAKFHTQIRDVAITNNRDQEAQRTWVDGKRDTAFEGQKPFTIATPEEK